ncbi:potassium transporter [Escherichia phage IMM-001]|nr:potassium transporter [Escherichia phage IMM-001]
MYILVYFIIDTLFSLQSHDITGCNLAVSAVYSFLM